METKTINVYKYDELSEKAKEKARNAHIQHNDMDFLPETLKEYLLTLLEENKIKVLNDSLKLLYSLSYCQGDGFCFIGSFEYKDLFIKISHNFNYYHEKSVNFDINKIEIINGEQIETEANEKEFNEFKNLYESICIKCEKEGYSYIDYENSEESIKDFFEVNNITFRENGEIENI